MTSIKVNYRGKIREIDHWPQSMDAFREQCDRKFSQYELNDSTSTRWSDLNSDPTKLSTFLSQSLPNQN
jgi:hypothetical protein